MDRTDKEKKKAWKAEHKLRARAAFPLHETELAGLFDYLSAELQKQGCDHTHRLTSQWIISSGYPEELIMPWLEDTGGYCDCEIMANTYDHFMQNRADA